MPYVIFSTPIGTCGLAYGDAGITQFGLPERDETTLRGRRFAGAEAALADAPAWVQGAVALVVRHLTTGREDLAALPVDLAGVPPFHREVYEASLKIPPGKVVTYGEMAAALGNPGAARAVGVALSKNPIALIVPCHRIVAASDGGGGFSAFGGLSTKRQLLEREGAVPRPLF